MKTNKQPKENSINKEKGFDVDHKNQLPQLPKPIINAPKEATDPSEMIKHA